MSTAPAAAHQIPQEVVSIIHGEHVRCAGGAEIPVIYPATEETVTVLREADAAQVDAAVRSARARRMGSALRQRLAKSSALRARNNVRKDVFEKIKE